MVSSDWVLVFATLMGPVFAVQAQKWVERARERGNTKRWITYTLMATRGARLSQEHVNALNAIDLAYYGTHFAARRRQRGKERTVIDRWHAYLNHLNTMRPADAGDAQKAWDDVTNDLFFNLLDALLVEQRFDFDLIGIKRGGYSPAAHYTVEWQNMVLRNLTVEWLHGQRAVRVNVDPPAAVTAP